jgi:hypothetical protein
VRALIIAFVILILFPARAFAHPHATATATATATVVPPLPAHATGALVRVDAYEHFSLGAVVGDGHLVLVPFEVIEVARPVWPHAFVIDATGKRHPAGLAATDRASGLALLAVEHAITATPFTMSPSTMNADIGTFAVSHHPWSGPLPESVWNFYPPGTLAGRHPNGCEPSCRPPPWPAGGSPVIDSEGRLVAIMGDAGFFGTSVIDLPANELARLDGRTRARRPLVFYGGFGTQVSFLTDGGVWFGLTASFAARIRDVIELRVDGEFSGLFDSSPKAPRPPEEDCSKRACYAGIRGVVTPSIGYRYVVGGFGGMRAFPIALTPSIGVAFGTQDTRRDNGASAADGATPGTWAQLAPGLTFSIPLGEVRARVRVPFDGTSSPTIELGTGIYF